MLALGVGNAWGAEKTITLTYSDFGLTTSYAQKTATVDGIGFTVNQGYKGSGNVIQMNSSKGAGVLYNTTSIAGLKSITVNVSSGSKTYTITSGTAQTPSGNSQTGTATKTFSIPSGDTYFQLKVSGASYFSSIVITYDDSNSGGETPEPEPDPTPDPGTGTTGTLVITRASFPSGSLAYNTTDNWSATASTGETVSGQGDLYSTSNQTTMQTKNSSVSTHYHNTTAMPGAISKISVEVASGTDRSYTVYASTTAITSTTGLTSLGSLKGATPIEIDPTKDYKYFWLQCTGGASYLNNITIMYNIESSGGDEPETPATELTDAQFAWSAATAEATMGASNTFPTLTNTLPVSVTYESVTPATATIDATSGAITLVAPGTTTISAKFAGGEIGGTTYAAKTITYALTVLKAPATATDNVYVKVTETAGITDGEYLIVYEDAEGNPKAPVAFDGSLAPVKLDVDSNNIEVSIASNTIAGNTDIDAATFTINTAAGTIQTKDGYYIGQTSNANGLATSTTTEYTNTISIENDGSATIISSGGAYLRYNSANDNLRFRYFKSSTYTAQKAIALYKKASSHTLTYGTCTNGSVSADVADGATVLSGTTITLSNTPTTDYKLTAYDVYKTGDATTKVTVTDGKFIMPEFDVTISATFELAKTLTGIEITTPATQTTFWQGETFNSTGLKVTAHFDGASDEDVTDKVTVTGSTATAGAAVEVTVSFTEGTTTKTTTYTINVKAIPNTKETAYTVADAYDIIDKLTTAEGVFISGIISQVDSYNGTYNSITYWISADGTTTNQLQAYSGKGLEGANFSAVTDIAKGAQVIICGDLKKYGSTYEFDKNNYLADYIATTKQEAGITYAITEYTAKVNEAFSTPVLTNPNSLTVTYSSSDENLATIDAATGAVTILDKTGKVTITATFAGNESYLYGTASYNITISDPNLTEATFDATADKGNTEQGEGSIAKSPITFACTDGILGNGSEYRLYKDATISFTAENGYAITKVVITSTASGTSKYGPGLLSTENGTYSYSDKTGTWVGEAQTVTFTATAQSRAKLITVYYKTDNRQDAGLVWSTENVSITLGDAFTAPTLSNPNGLTLTCTSDNENLATVTNAGVVTLKSGVTGKATITAKFDGNSNYKDATVTCTITVNPKTEIVVILAQYNGQWYALKNVEETAGKVLAALPVNYVGGKLYNVEEADKATIEWQRAAVTDGIIFKNGENYIYGTAGSTDLKLSTTECAWTLDGTTYKLGNRTFFYNETANGFKNYNTSNAGNSGYSNLPIVTAPVYAIGDAYGRTVTTGEYGTICIPYGSSNYTGAEFYEISWMEMDGTTPKGIWLDQVNGALTAGKPYIFKATADEIAIVGDGTTAAAPVVGVAGLTGTFTLIQDSETSGDASNTLEGNYMIAGNQFLLCGTGCWLKENRAYIDATIIANHTTKKAVIPGRRRVCLGETSENTTTGVDNNQLPNANIQKVIENGQFIIIRDGVKYNVQGQVIR